MKRWKLAACLVLAGPLALTEAQGPTSRPASPERGPRDPEQQRAMERFHGYRDRYPASREAVPAETSWLEVERFMDENSPLRLAALNAEQPDPQRRLKRFWTFRFNALKRLERDDADLYAERVRMLREEDKIWGLGKECAMESDPSKREALAAALRREIGGLFRTALKEREVRIKRAEELLLREKQLLAEEQADQAQIIDKRVEQVLEHAGELWFPGMGDWPDRPRVQRPAEPERRKTEPRE